MNRRHAWLGLAALAIVALVVALVLWDRSDSVETVAVTRGSIDVTIQTVGTIQAPDATVVRVRVAGVIAQLGAGAGDIVATGDILVILDQAPFDRAVADAQGQLTQAEFALQLAELRADQSPDDETRRFEVLAAVDRVERAQQAIVDAEEQRRRSVVTATVAGTIIEVPVRAGDAIGANQPVARIAQADDLRLVADVDELDLPNVAPGATVEFRLDAYPAIELGGQVQSTAPVARQQGGATVFATTIEYAAPADIDIRPGMNADVTIVTDARDNVLLIPDRALRTVGTRSFVVVEESGSTIEREVTLGYRGQGEVEVVSGLNEGDRVVLR